MITAGRGLAHIRREDIGRQRGTVIRWCRSATVVSTLLIVLVAAGCGRRRGIDKVIVEGNVTYGGETVVNGDIKFYPVEGTKGPVSGAAIKDGHYIVKNKDGVPVGTHTVQIRAFRVNQGAAADDDLISAGRAQPKSARGQFLPEKYNRNTELIVEVSETTNELDFELEK